MQLGAVNIYEWIDRLASDDFKSPVIVAMSGLCLLIGSDNKLAILDVDGYGHIDVEPGLNQPVPLEMNFPDRRSLPLA